MGTRHLIAVQIDGDYKIAQYGQWDGYPDGQGASVIDFLNSADLEAFKAKLRAVTWITKDQIETVNATPNWTSVYPHLSRDAGAEILTMVLNSDKPIFLQDTRGFAGDSLFCEWAYVIDFDKGTFEIFKGFNQQPTPADSRFPSGAEWLEKSTKYQPVALVQTYQLDCLPSKEGFLSDLNGPEEADDDAA